MNDPERPRCTGTMPVELTCFVGRRTELADVAAALSAVRLVTLIGVGGVGKTRVAVRAARAAQQDYADGTYWVDLSALSDPDLLPNTVSALVDLPERAEQVNGSQLPALLSYLAGKRLLLVLDTCEHLIDACARFVQTLLEHCPDVRVLATSRQPLNVPGERLLRILPLPAPDPDDDQDQPGESNDAMVLFAERAAAVVPGFRLTDDNRLDVARLCHRLDGIPLAIELAVVRLRALPLSELLDRLNDRFRLLTGGRRAGLPRHQTLRAAIDWSYQLCSPQEQQLWNRLSVFAGVFELAAVEEICSDDFLPAGEILDHLIGLLDKAIVAHLDGDGAGYRMLDTIREYGAERLTDSGDEHLYRARHRDHYLALARQFEREWLSDKQVGWIRRLTRELASFRNALEFCCTTEGEAAAGLELAADLLGLWICTDRNVEGVLWLDRLLPLVPESSPHRPRATAVVAQLCLASGQIERARVLSQQALEADPSRDAATTAYINFVRGTVYTVTGMQERGLACFAASRHLFDEVGDRGGQALPAVGTAASPLFAGRYEEARVACEAAAAASLDSLADSWLRSWFIWVRACALWGVGQFGSSEHMLRDALRLSLDIHHIEIIACCFDVFGWIAAAQGRYELAARQLGAASKLWERFHRPLVGSSVMQRAHDEAVLRARSGLGDVRYQELFGEGMALRLNEAVASLGVPAQAVTPSPGQWSLLTPREREIAVLVAEGLTNRQIAERLVISKRTADSHVEHILRKLAYSSRAQIASLAAAQQKAPEANPAT